MSLENYSKLRSIRSIKELEMIIYPFVSSWSDCNSLLNKNKLACFAVGAEVLHRLPVLHRVHDNCLLLTFRALHDQALAYTSELVKL